MIFSCGSLGYGSIHVSTFLMNQNIGFHGECMIIWQLVLGILGAELTPQDPIVFLKCS